MKDGKIIDRGKYDELLEQNGSYAVLVKSQLSPEEIVNLNLKLKNKINTKDLNINEMKDNFKDEDISLSDTDLFSINQTYFKDEKEKKNKNRKKEIMEFNFRP